MIYVGGGGGFVIEALASGVEKTAVNKAIKGANIVCVRRIPGLTVEQVELMKDKAYSLIYANYDYLQIAGLALYKTLSWVGFRWAALIPNSATKIICSELYGVCCMCIPLKFKSRVKLITPDDLFDTDQMVTVLTEKT
jgi:hypothetical protein